MSVLGEPCVAAWSKGEFDVTFKQVNETDRYRKCPDTPPLVWSVRSRCSVTPFPARRLLHAELEQRRARRLQRSPLAAHKAFERAERRLQILRLKLGAPHLGYS